jgi:ABC-type multidrug transport system permease subunit
MTQAIDNQVNDHVQSARSYSPFGQLVLARLREFYREPEAIFWVYGFPILIVVALGIAFRSEPVEEIGVDVEDGPQAQAVAAALRPEEELKVKKFKVESHDADTCRRHLRTGKTDVMVRVSPTTQTKYEYVYDPTRAKSVLARDAVDDALQRAAGRKDPVPSEAVKFEEPGGRYIDWLVPGLMGMSLMGGGLWGVGFVTVDMRIRKLLKRFLATPMKKSHFLAAIMSSRLLFMVPEILILLIFARLSFGVVIQGNILAVIALICLGAFTFAGIGLLVASRARTLETVSGLMNLVMLPMWVCSGIFFSSERFPEVVQPLIKLVPLTPLISALRAVMLESSSLAELWPQLTILAVWGVVTFTLALRWFRWN